MDLTTRSNVLEYNAIPAGSVSETIDLRALPNHFGRSSFENSRSQEVAPMALHENSPAGLRQQLGPNICFLTALVSRSSRKCHVSSTVQPRTYHKLSSAIQPRIYRKLSSTSLQVTIQRQRVAIGAMGTSNPRTFLYSKMTRLG